MAHQTLSFLARYAVPPEILWQVVTDHEGMGRWLGVPVKVIAAPPGGGVGTVRRIAAGPLSIDEEVVVFEPPRRMIYRIVRGLPVRYHRGEVRISPFRDDGSELAWEITIASGVPFLAETVSGILRRRINRGLRALRDLLDEG